MIKIYALYTEFYKDYSDNVIFLLSFKYFLKKYNKSLKISVFTKKTKKNHNRIQIPIKNNQ
jgi:hypothetical protein